MVRGRAGTLIQDPNDYVAEASESLKVSDVCALWPKGLFLH